MKRRIPRSKRFAKKRYYRKKKSSTQVNVNRALRPFAQRYITKMKYAEAFSIGGSGPQAQRMLLNSVYDPNSTGTGHQPYGHDTLSAIYNRYRVISCSYAISAVDAAGRYIQICALPANDNVLTLSTSDMRENPRAKYIVQAPQASMRMLKGKVYLPSLVGRTKQQYMSDDRYQAAVGSSPQEAAVLNIFIQDMADGSNVLNTNLNITLEYTVEWFDVKNLGQS